MKERENRGGLDRMQINVSEEYEVKYWAQKFDVSTDELKEAVKHVGTNARNVEECVHKNIPRNR